MRVQRGVLFFLLAISCDGDVPGRLEEADPLVRGRVTGARTRIDSVETSEGDTQMRQGDTVVLVIRGHGLKLTNAVTLDSFAGTITVLSVRDREVRAQVDVAHGESAGPRTITLSGPQGSVSRADAVEVTHYIVAAGAGPGGRGTFQSPLVLCDPAVRTALAGDTIDLLAGEHACDVEGFDPLQLPVGVAMIGAGPDTTVVRGGAASFVGFFLFGDIRPPAFPTVLRGFRVVAPAPLFGSVIEIDGTTALTVEDLAIEGPGFRPGRATGTIERLDVECSGFGIGLDALQTVQLTVTSSRLAGCGVGTSMVFGTMSIHESVVERCGAGLETLPGFESHMDVTGCQLVDNGTGIRARGGSVDVMDTLIRDDESTATASLTGILVRSALVTVTGGEIIGQDRFGIDAFSSVEEPGFLLRTTGLLIQGGRVGIDADGRDNANTVVLRDTIVRDQTDTALRMRVEGQFVTVDLGNGGGPGGNQLSVVSGIALDDLRMEPDEFTAVIDATGILLNGRSYAGQLIQGPASALPDYRIVSDGLIQF